MRFNIRKFLWVFLCLELCLLCSGCTSAWIKATNSALFGLDSLIAAILAFVGALEGRTISKELADKIRVWTSNVQTSIANVRDRMAAFAKDKSTLVLGQVRAVIEVLIAQLNSILVAITAITDAATFSKLKELVSLAIGTAQAILAMLPSVAAAIDAKVPRDILEKEDENAGALVDKSLIELEEDYEAIIKDKTTNPTVNHALDEMPRSLNFGG
jgi:hypothetical protein